MERASEASHRFRTLLVVGAVAVALTGSGCSIFFAHGPPPEDERTGYFECTRSKALPSVDLVVMLTQIGRTLFALAAPDSFYRNLPITRSADITAGVSLAALYGMSAGIGFDKVARCREAQGGAWPANPYRRPPPRQRPRRHPPAEPSIDATSAATSAALPQARPPEADEETDVPSPPPPAPAVPDAGAPATPPAPAVTPAEPRVRQRFDSE